MSCDITAPRRQELQERVLHQIRERVWKMVHSDETQQLLERVSTGLATLERATPCLAGAGLTIETAGVQLKGKYIDQHAGVEPGAYAVLAVEDTGMGMDEETQSHIFEPFFTTKEVGKGTGLGLSTVYGIVKQNHGQIWVYSEPGRGAIFKIYLPWIGEEAQPSRPDAVSSASLRGTETVLVAEDDESLQRLIQRTLTEQGYTVLTAGCGKEALQVGTQRQGQIELLITDMVMPGMQGRELAERLASLGLVAKVLYISGYTENGLGNPRGGRPEVNFLPKPFSPDGLARQVRQLIDGLPEESHSG